MAYDSYRNPAEQAPPYYEYPDSRSQYANSYTPAEAYKPKSRQSSRDRGEGRATEYPRFSQPHQPINEAVNAAFVDKAADPTAGMNPELIAHITETVIKQLRTTSLDAGTPIQATHQTYPPPPPPPPQQPPPLSPTMQSRASPPMPTRNVYTPPSPPKYPDYPNTASPPMASTNPQAGPPSPPEPSSVQFDPRRPPSRTSMTNEPTHVRPKGPTRLSTSKEETTLEKIWGQLFDEEGQPTPRLGQLLRGLAVHLIEDYEPRQSIVVTPPKMQAYYERFRVSDEAYPWSIIFDDKESSISRMYRELECQHHLVQERHDERPDIPGLTPVGFERWGTLIIRAHPEEEFERLQKTVLEMPISNPDDKKERFPKDISRRLFPVEEDRKTRDRLQKAMVEHAHITLPKATNLDVPRAGPSEPASRPTREAQGSQESAHIPTNIERERKPYSSTPQDCAIDDTNTPIQPIERERKPYRVQPGAGRVYEEEGRTTIPNHGVRSNSTVERTRPIPIGPQGPRLQGDLPTPEIHQPIRGPASVRRRHSPSFSAGNNEYRRSDGDLRTFQPGTESYEDDGRRYMRDTDLRRGEYARRQADEDAAHYSGSPSSKVRYDPRADPGEPRRSNNQTDEEYYRPAPRGYDYGGGSIYR
ncbi:hypothetical protein MMC34_000139 [Xylographa carneopallida]|nr:hypothetical protein [Xylographa carneopallida]